ncbi:MAG TPA: ATP-binding protein [Chitinophagaceae bacterium]|nr:ATP-binding protein [Chitinophagaceae bacterium]
MNKFKMKYGMLLMVQLLICSAGFSQLNFGLLQSDSLKHELSIAREDSSRSLIMANLAESYRWSMPDSAMMYGQQALNLARQINFPKGEANALISISVIQRELGNLPKALDYALKALAITHDHHYDISEISSLVRVANVYVELKNYEQALPYFQSAEKKATSIHSQLYMMITRWLLAENYSQLNKLDSAQFFARAAEALSNNMGSGVAFSYNILGDLLLKLNKDEEALANYRLGLKEGNYYKDYRSVSNLNIRMANYYKRKNQLDSAIYYGKQGLATAQVLAYKNRIMSASNLLAELYESTDPKEALKYYKISTAARDSLFSFQKLQAVENTRMDEKEKLYEINKAKTAYQNKVRLWLMIGGLAVFLSIILILFRNNKQKQKANALLHRQKKEIDLQKEKLQESLDHLKTTQAQLIQSEKMASLGEMSAGIAHEIQNPLNFVNNFSEVNAELIDEWKEETAKGNMQLANKIADDIKENLNKTVEHGKRADAIVKGMLQHTRSGSSAKEPTDINALADEYFRLAYHGLRAKDHSFNVTMKTDFDASIGKINIVPQDIGRVILNLITNAFYAVNEKCLTPQPPKGGKYEPIVTVATKSVTPLQGGRGVMISVKDNGNGIPQKVLDKIFQPFFTTKPTGQGTGLGLSLSYDIVKAHGGELKVETKEGEGSEFIIIL